MFYEPIRELHQLNQLYQAGRVAGERVNEILEAVKEGKADEEKLERLTKRGAGRVEYQHVSFSYRPEVPGLQDIHVMVEPGRMVALVGPTGAGKTTFVALLNRFYELNGGAILLDGRDIKTLSLKDLRSQIGLVSQETFLFNGTVMENLRFAQPKATREQIIAAAKAACVHEFVDRLPEKYDTAVGERGVKLSVGEKQRISIARALLKDAPILVLDEATASVDTATERLIQDALAKLLKNRTSFVIAHRLSTIREADLILVLEKGKIAERGNHVELMKRNGLYADLIRKQSDPWTDTLQYAPAVAVAGAGDDEED
jgi:ATP-binding cassette subfamily B protein/subfamily B ATP-binding cassette protein MsbA